MPEPIEGLEAVIEAQADIDLSAAEYVPDELERLATTAFKMGRTLTVRDAGELSQAERLRIAGRRMGTVRFVL